MPFDLQKLQVERLRLEITYHRTYTFFGLQGVLAERWAHGPVFGAVGEAGSGQLNLTPASGAGEDDRLVGVIGIHTSALLAEGQRWIPEAKRISAAWFEDIFTVLKPQRTVRYQVELLALYPIRDPYPVTRRLVDYYYQRDSLQALVDEERFLAAIDFFAPDEDPHRTVVLGALGPPHRGQYFTFEDADRDSRWWMALRVVFLQHDEAGIAEPVIALSNALAQGYEEVSRVARTALPRIVGD